MGCSPDQPVTIAPSNKPLTDEEKQLFKEADANGDGKLSFEEVWQQCKGMFPKIVVQVLMALCDSNGDNHINQDEFSKFFKILDECANSRNNDAFISVLFKIADKCAESDIHTLLLNFRINF